VTAGSYKICPWKHTDIYIEEIKLSTVDCQNNGAIIPRAESNILDGALMF
jgi:hypothetical protein